MCIVIYCFRLGIVESGDCVYCYLLFQTGYCGVRLLVYCYLLFQTGYCGVR